MNPGPPPREYANKDQKTCEIGIKAISLEFDKNELDAYTQKRLSGIAEKTKGWIIRASQVFWEQTQGNVNYSTIQSLYNYTIDKWSSRFTWSKILSFAKAFLKYLSKTRFDQRFQAFEIYLEMPKAVKEKKRTTSRIVTINDVQNVIKAILKAFREGRLPKDRALNYVTTILFGAYTGQRPYCIRRTRSDQIEKALKQELPVLKVDAQQDKIRMEHYVPLHPNLVQFLKVQEVNNGEYFLEKGLERWLKRNRLPLERSKEFHFVVGDLRKFAEQYGDIIKWNSSNRAYILTHNVSSVDWESYKHPLPEFVYKIYMEAWKDVDLIPKEAYELLEEFS